MTFLAIIMMVFAFAGMIKGMIGLGLPAVSMGLLTIAMSPFQAASLLIVPSMVTNVWQLLPKDMSGLYSPFLDIARRYCGGLNMEFSTYLKSKSWSK